MILSLILSRKVRGLAILKDLTDGNELYDDGLIQVQGFTAYSRKDIRIHSVYVSFGPLKCSLDGKRTQNRLEKVCFKMCDS